jgi:tRNA(Ile2) C34 agmatinyltransferase TiaS
MVRLDWLISNILGGVKLAVSRSNVRAAEELLAEPMPRGFRVEGVGLYEQPACPTCGSQDVRLSEFGTKWRCRVCSREWEEL